MEKNDGAHMELQRKIYRRTLLVGSVLLLRAALPIYHTSDPINTKKRNEVIYVPPLY